MNNSVECNDGDPLPNDIRAYEFWQTSLKRAHLVLAPMVDQSELAWRLLSRRYGAELCYTPMLHASVFVRNATYRRESLISCAEDRPLIVQFCANDPAIFLEAARLAAPYCDAVDLNLGCPQSIAKRGHYGAFLQDEWDLLFKMINLVNQELKIPVTCKIRIFENITKTVQYAQKLESAGCKLLTVHGRTRDQKGPLTGVANWDQIKAVKQNVNIPVFANGNIQYLSDVYRCLKETGVDGVMTAEGSLHNPAIFHGLNPPIWEMAEEYLDLVEIYPAPVAFIRGHIFKIFHHSLQIHVDLRDELAKVKTSNGFREVTQKVKQRCKEDQERYKENPFLYPFELPFPHWICQPYVRPSPEEAERRQSERQERTHKQLEWPTGMKRPLEAMNGETGEALSKNKIKKMMRHPKKNFKIAPTKYEKCQTCGNPKGLKCIFSLCKVCCKKRAYCEIVDCIGHNFMFKTKREKREQWEKEKRFQEQQEVKVLEENFNTHSIVQDVQIEDDAATDSTTSTICD